MQEHLSEIQKGGTQKVLIATWKLVLYLAEMLQILQVFCIDFASNEFDLWWSSFGAFFCAYKHISFADIVDYLDKYTSLFYNRFRKSELATKAPRHETYRIWKT